MQTIFIWVIIMIIVYAVVWWNKTDTNSIEYLRAQERKCQFELMQEKYHTKKEFEIMTWCNYSYTKKNMPKLMFWEGGPTDIKIKELPDTIQTSSSRLEEGYMWAQDNSISNFEECDKQFWSSVWWAEDWCNQYVQEVLYNKSPAFWWYDCTEDCSWHKAGYKWAERTWINGVKGCWGNSQSFMEGCYQYVEDNY